MKVNRGWLLQISFRHNSHTNFYALTELNNLKVQTNTKLLQTLTTRRGRSPRLRPPRTPRARPPRVPLEDTLHTQTPRFL